MHQCGNVNIIDGQRTVHYSHVHTNTYDNDDSWSHMTTTAAATTRKKYTRRAYTATKMEMPTTRTTQHRVNAKKNPNWITN